MSDSWETDGNCEQCRKEKYCRKLCTAAKKSRGSFIDSAIRKMIPNFNIKKNYR